MKSKYALAAMVLGTLVALAIFAAPATIAQVRAALVKNVDEPGLVPFSQSFTISQPACGCTNCCFIRTSDVPAGKRLVIQNISGFFPLNTVGNAGYINVFQEDPVGGVPVVINTITPVFRNQWNGTDYPAYEFNQVMLAYVDPGKRASITLFNGPGFGATRSGVLTVNGYMVSLQ